MTYDILSDPAYQSSFYFVTLDQRHEQKSSLYDFIPSVLYQGEDFYKGNKNNKGASAKLFYDDAHFDSPKKMPDS